MNFTALKAQLSLYIKRPTDTTDASLTHFLDMGTDRINRDLKVGGQIQSKAAVLSTDSNGRYVALPPLFRHSHRLRLNTTPVDDLEYVAPRLMDSQFSRQGTDRPAFYTVVGQKIELDVTPDSNYQMEIAFLEKFPKLSASVATNWLTDNAEDVLIYAALIAAEAFLGRDSRLAAWKVLYDGLIESLNKQEMFYGGRITARPATTVM